MVIVSENEYDGGGIGEILGDRAIGLGLGEVIVLDGATEEVDVGVPLRLLLVSRRIWMGGRAGTARLRLQRASGDAAHSGRG